MSKWTDFYLWISNWWYYVRDPADISSE